jgi:hypothetical protein
MANVHGLAARIVALALLGAALAVGAGGCSQSSAPTLAGSSSKKSSTSSTSTGSAGPTDNQNPSSSSPTTSSSSPAAASNAAVTADGTAQQSVVTSVITSSGETLQVKDFDLLSSSIVSCMGSGMTGITADMLMPASLSGPAPAPLPDGKIRFLLPSQYNAGDDALQDEEADLLDLANGVRTSTAGDGLSDTYLRALETIANVVAHNCSSSNQNCSCGTPAEATAMITRCLPALDPTAQNVQDAANSLSAMCATGEAGMREAVASLLSSYAFASAR